MRLKIITPPASEPVTLTDAKNSLRIDSTADDTVITNLIKQAREWCEDYQKKKYITQTLEVYLDNFPRGSIEFTDCSPVQSIESIKYIDSEGVEHTVLSSDYELDNVSFVNKVDLLYNKSWPNTALKPNNGIKIRFVAGGAASEVRETVKQAMILQMKLLYETYSDDEQKRIERARDSLLRTRRVISV